MEICQSIYSLLYQIQITYYSMFYYYVHYIIDHSNCDLIEYEKRLFFFNWDTFRFVFILLLVSKSAK